MALPAGVAAVRVHSEAIVDAAGNPVNGYLYLTVPQEITHAGSGMVVVPQTVKVPVSAGTFDATVVATDAAGLSLSSWTYQASEKWTGGRSFPLALPAAAPDVEYASLVPTVVSAGTVMVPALVESVNGQSGAVVLTAADVGAQPSDADLTAIAGLDSTTAGTVATDGAGWIKKTYAQLKAALGITPADVGGFNTAAAAAAPVQSVAGLTGTPTVGALDAAGLLSKTTANGTYAPLAAAGVLAARPTASGSERYYFATDDGAGTLYADTAAGVWTPLNPGEIAYAANITGTVTTSANGSIVDIPGCAITIPATKRPVWLKMHAIVQQSAAGQGNASLYLYETTSGATLVTNFVEPLANLTSGGRYLDISGEYRLGPVTSPRSFKISIVTIVAASTTPAVQAINTAANPSWLLAEMR